jgi:hypothetical protein
MQGVLRLRQVGQKKAEVHAESPRVAPSGGRLGEENQQTRLRARYGYARTTAYVCRLSSGNIERKRHNG